MRFRPLLIVVVSLIVGGTLQAQSAPASGRAFTPADWYRVAQVGSPVMRPDGRFIAVQVTRADESANARRSEIWVVATDGSEPVRFSAPGTHSTNPRFSPDGNTLIFNSSRPGVSNTVWGVRLDRAGGEFPYVAPPPGPPEPSGSLPTNRRFAISTGGVAGVPAQPPGGAGRGGGAPGGRAGGAAQGGAAGGRGAGDGNPYSDMPPMARPPANAITLPLDPDRFDGMHITDMRYKANGQGFVPSTGRGGGRGAGAQQPDSTPPATPAPPGGRGGRGGVGAPVGPPAQIFIDRFDGRGRQPITSTDYSHRNALVSPDGRLIAFQADTGLRSDSIVASIPVPPTPPVRDTASSQIQGPPVNTSDIFILPVAGGTPRRIHTPGNEGNIQWSPDSRFISYTANKGRNTSTVLYLVDVQRGVTTEVTEGERFELGTIRWTPSNELLFDMTVGGRNGVYRVSPRDMRIVEAAAGRRRVSSVVFDSAMTRMAYISTSVNHPTELYISDLTGANERKLTGFNDELMAEVAFSPADQFMYKSVGDLEIEAWLMYPYGYQAGQRYPLVLYIHGGPHSAYGEGWFDEFQNIAGAGMFVLFTNPRGSSGFGPQFSNTIRGRWGDEDYMDIMRAVDIVAARPDVDSTRMGVTGGSYGGFMTAWITTKTDRFRAAQADRMISNWVSWYGISDAQSLTEGEFFGRPWENWDLYVDLSPIKYADRVRTPTLIVQSEEDHRTPMADAEQWFMALQKHGVPAEFIRYPRSTHDLSRTGEPWLLVDRLNRLRQWFAYWLKDESAPRLTAATAGSGVP